LTNVICPSGFVCPTASNFTQTVRVPLTRDQFGTAFISAGPPSWKGEELVRVEFRDRNDEENSFPYSVLQLPPPTPEGLVLVQSMEESCESIMFRDSRGADACSITNEYIVAPTP
jgi:hypothetical protein